MSRLLRGALLMGALAIGLAPGASARADGFGHPYGPGGRGYGGYGRGYGYGHRGHYCHHHRRWNCGCGRAVPGPIYGAPVVSIQPYPYPYPVPPAPAVRNFSFGFSTGAFGYPGGYGGYPW